MFHSGFHEKLFVTKGENSKHQLLNSFTVAINSKYGHLFKVGSD